MFGFHFPENFNQPYRAKSITEFWTRWHMTVGRFFRDFLYIPLGGSRKGELRTYINLFLMFFLLGCWHGAAWTFIIVGIYHGTFVMIERFFKNKYNFVMRGFIANFITFILVLLSLVIFRSETVAKAVGYLQKMFFISEPSGFKYYHLKYFLTKDILFYLFFSFVFAFIPVELFKKDWAKFPLMTRLLKSVTIIILLVSSVLILSTTGFNPFIYFRF
jgi:alginate O-acetyltransferase complex protein AlgI